MDYVLVNRKIWETDSRRIGKPRVRTRNVAPFAGSTIELIPVVDVVRTVSVTWPRDPLLLFLRIAYSSNVLRSLIILYDTSS